MLKLLRLLHTITGSLNAVVKKEKVQHVFLSLCNVCMLVVLMMIFFFCY